MPRFFSVLERSNKSRARRGRIELSHGVVETPAFVPVGTKATIKGLTQDQIQSLSIQISFVNTYHLVTHPGSKLFEQVNGVHEWARYRIPLMSDSGGFQVFSLAQNKRKAAVRGDEQPLVEKISEDGVCFRSLYDGTLVEFTPESSMHFQSLIGADITIAFDECTYYPSSHEYAKKAMERTHRWLGRCIAAKKKEDVQRAKIPSRAYPRYLYGVIQGGTYIDLRKQSAAFVCDQQVDGIAIGGVSVGESKEEMREQVSWVSSFLPSDRPVHLLGVGQVDDILELVGQGIDTFDCVEPTRLARMGVVYTPTPAQPYSIDQIDITRSEFRYSEEPLAQGCDCVVCAGYTRSYIHHLFKQRELLGYTLATYHNLFVMETLFRHIRLDIERGVL